MKGLSRAQLAVRGTDPPFRDQGFHAPAQGHLHVVLPRILKGSPREILVVHPPVLLQVQPSFRDQHMDVGVDVHLRAEGMHDHDDPRNEAPFPAPFQDGLPRCREQDIQQLPVPEEHIPELVRNRPDDMAVGDVYELRDGFFHPVIRRHLAAGRTEP